MSMTMDSFTASIRRFSPRLLLSELLLKQWFEPVIPFTVMIALWLYFALTIPDYASIQNTLRCSGCLPNSASWRWRLEFA